MASKTYLGEFEQLVLLTVLSLDRDAFGVEIARALERAAGRDVSRGALYTTLDRLEGKGLVRWKPAVGAAARGGAPRRCYSVTPRGVAALRDSRHVLMKLWRGLEGVLSERSTR